MPSWLPHQIRGVCVRVIYRLIPISKLLFVGGCCQIVATARVAIATTLGQALEHTHPAPICHWCGKYMCLILCICTWTKGRKPVRVQWNLVLFQAWNSKHKSKCIELGSKEYDYWQVNLTNLYWKEDMNAWMTDLSWLMMVNPSEASFSWRECQWVIFLLLCSPSECINNPGL